MTTTARKDGKPIRPRHPRTPVRWKAPRYVATPAAAWSGPKA